MSDSQRETTQPKCNDYQIGGDHYSKHGSLQHWDVVHHFDLDYMQGQITKYVMRWKDKNGIEDLLKARHYLDKYIELIHENMDRSDVGEDDDTDTKSPVCDDEGLDEEYKLESNYHSTSEIKSHRDNIVASLTVLQISNLNLWLDSLGVPRIKDGLSPKKDLADRLSLLEDM